jgi:hypothetical protein
MQSRPTRIRYMILTSTHDTIATIAPTCGRKPLPHPPKDVLSSTPFAKQTKAVTQEARERYLAEGHCLCGARAVMLQGVA